MSDIREMGPYRLAALADCGSPVGLDSPGAEWLRSVRDAAVECHEYFDRERTRFDRDEAVTEIADSAVPVYNIDRWSVFVDLAAWREDPYEVASSGLDMTELAGVALYMIAERLVLAVFEALDDEPDNTDEPHCHACGLRVEDCDSLVGRCNPDCEHHAEHH